MNNNQLKFKLNKAKDILLRSRNTNLIINKDNIIRIDIILHNLYKLSYSLNGDESTEKYVMISFTFNEELKDDVLSIKFNIIYFRKIHDDIYFDIKIE